MNITLVNINEHRERVTFDKKFLGEIVREVDGYWVWYPEINNGGCYTQWLLVAIAKLLNERNAPWHKTVCQMMEETKSLQGL